MANKRLGAGLSELFGGDVSEFFEDQISNNYDKESVVEIPLKEITPNPYQPRKVFDDEKLDELAASIKEHGVFQPILLRKASVGYNIIAGERRYRASLQAGMETIPAIVTDKYDDEKVMIIALLENTQRENLNAIEEAEAYHAIIEYSGCTQEALAQTVGKSRTHITNVLGLRRLNQKVRDLILEGKLTMGHAKPLSNLDDDQVDYVINETLSKGLSAREVELLVKKLKTEGKPSKPKTIQRPEYVAIEDRAREKFGTKVKVDNKAITISFEDDDDLTRLLEILDINID